MKEICEARLSITDEYQTIKDSILKENDLNGDDIRDILVNKLKSTEYVYRKERSPGWLHTRPFDLSIDNTFTKLMYGLEIKGDKDNYKLLGGQMFSYAMVFDEIYLVLHKKEAPDWLPEEIGILRVSTDNIIYLERHAKLLKYFDIASNWDWNALLSANNINLHAGQARSKLTKIDEIRRNFLFNRLFAVQKGWDSQEYEKVYLLDEESKKLLTGFQVPEEMSYLKRDIRKLEKRLDILKSVLALDNED